MTRQWNISDRTMGEIRQLGQWEIYDKTMAEVRQDNGRSDKTMGEIRQDNEI